MAEDIFTRQRGTRRLGHLAAGGGLALVLFLGGASVCQADTPAKVDRSQPTPQPDYPDTAQTNGEQGDVLVDVLVSTNGLPHKIRISQSSGFQDLDNAAAAAVASWHYLPAVKDGNTKTDWTTVKIHFALPQPPPQATPAPAQH